MSALRNFHVPLPADIYSQLRQEADKRNEPATVLARQAIEYWLKEQRKAARRQAIYEYAKEVAGSLEDLDTQLETIAIESLLESEQ